MLELIVLLTVFILLGVASSSRASSSSYSSSNIGSVSAGRKEQRPLTPAEKLKLRADFKDKPVRFVSREDGWKLLHDYELLNPFHYHPCLADLIETHEVGMHRGERIVIRDAS